MSIITRESKKEDNLNFAIIGTGVAAEIHAKCIEEISETNLVAVSSLTRERAKRFAQLHGCDYYTDYNEMLKRDDIDIVCITTPSGTHAKIGIDVAKSGRHVIVEKPIDVSLKNAKDLIDACREENVKLSVIFQHRFADDIVTLKNAIDNGEVGRINFGAAHTKVYRTQEYYDRAEWRGTWELDGGGALINQSIHYVDLLYYLVGSIDEVFAYTATRGHEIEVEDEAVASVKFENGAIGLIEANTNAYPGFYSRLDIYGDNGSVIIQDDRIVELALKSGKREHWNESSTFDHASPAVPSDLHKRQFEDIVNAIKSGRESLVNGEEGLKSLEAVLAIYKSAKIGKSVKVKSLLSSSGV